MGGLPEADFVEAVLQRPDPPQSYGRLFYEPPSGGRSVTRVESRAEVRMRAVAVPALAVLVRRCSLSAGPGAGPQGLRLGGHGGHQRRQRQRPDVGRAARVRPGPQADGRGRQRRDSRRLRRRRHRGRRQRLARIAAQSAARGSRPARAADQPQLQAPRDDGGPRRDASTRCSSSATTPRPTRRAACSRTPDRAWCATCR